MLTPFSGDLPKNVAPVSYELQPSRWRVCVFFATDFFVCFSDIKRSEISDEKTKQNIRQRLRRESWNTRAKFRVYLQKRREHLDFCAENMRNLRSYVVIT